MGSEMCIRDSYTENDHFTCVGWGIFDKNDHFLDFALNIGFLVKKGALGGKRGFLGQKHGNRVFRGRKKGKENP